MSYQVLYRKYRPQTFSEVLGQERIVATLQGALLQKRVGHAYLLCGPRGTGKTTIARLLAKSLNCQNPKINEKEKTFEPCNNCVSCNAINKGSDLDLIEIDAASNRGIDEIRQLKEAVKFSPANSRYKVFIIDEAHMLTLPAFNALLKTLEEPPAHAIFVLATTDPEKIPPTILSRVQRFNFKKLSQATIFNKLKDISKEEKINIDDGALDILSQAADGCMRDGQSLLTQFILSGDLHISEEDVMAILGRVSFVRLEEFFDLAGKKDIAGIFDFLEKEEGEGMSLIGFLQVAIFYWRYLLLAHIDEKLLLQDSHLTNEQIKKIREQKKLISREMAFKGVEEFSSALVSAKNSPLPRISLELAILKVIE
jgi:DNA polymerase-3 subunit gamma/tau